MLENTTSRIEALLLFHNVTIVNRIMIQYFAMQANNDPNGQWHFKFKTILSRNVGKPHNGCVLYVSSLIQGNFAWKLGQKISDVLKPNEFYETKLVFNQRFWLKDMSCTCSDHEGCTIFQKIIYHIVSKHIAATSGNVKQIYKYTVHPIKYALVISLWRFPEDDNFLLNYCNGFGFTRHRCKFVFYHSLLS